jgi:hypothetical protein
VIAIAIFVPLVALKACAISGKLAAGRAKTATPPSRRQTAAQSPRGEPGNHSFWGVSAQAVGIASVPNPSANPVGGNPEGT